MRKIFIMSAAALLICGCSVFGSKISGSVDENVRNYDDLEKIKPLKHVVFECDFNKAARGLSGEFFCSGNENADYVSYFTSIAYQALPGTSSDYLMNLFRQLELDGRSLEKSALAAYSSKGADGFKTMDFDKTEPVTFAVEGVKKVGIFVSRRDVFLRNHIYPSLKLLSLEAPGEAEGKDALSEYRLKYAVYPHALSSFYSTDWISAFLGVPKFTDMEYSFESGGKEKILGYFSAMEKYKKTGRDYSLSSGSVTAAELARPFVFSGKIFSAYIGSKDPLKPFLPGEGEGFINEYLPSFSLEKVEIVRKSHSDKELVLKSWLREDIAGLMSNPDETAGFFFLADKIPSGALSIRFVHKAEKPRYDDEGVMRSEVSGLAFIYSSIGETIVTDLDIAEYFSIEELPVKCIEEADIGGLLEGAGFGGYEKARTLDMFTDALSACSSAQLVMTKVVFARDMDSRDIIK